MSSPIRNQIGNVFIPVNDMERAIAWYSQLFGLPVGTSSHNNTIYDVPMQGETGLILDTSKAEVQNSSQPLLFFWTDDMIAIYQFLREMKVEILSSIEDIGSVSYLIFRDPDQNLLMVCQSNQ